MKRFLSIILMTTVLFTGGQTMANALNVEQESIAEVAAYAARGNQEGLKKSYYQRT